MRLQVGQRVLHFVLERKLGEGGFGEVWRAKAGMAATALKFVSVAGEDLERGRKEYSRIKLMIENGAFNHDRLIKLHGAWLLDEHGEDIPDGVLESAVNARTMELRDQVIEPDTLLIQMDLGQESLASLLKRIRKGQPENSSEGVPIEDLLRYIREAAEGIDFLNTPRTTFDGQIRSAVYHCDIKPENLLLADGKVRICDYGVARIEGQRKTKSPNALSLAHASPELVDDQPCAQSDQYSLAVTYAQLRTGRLPFTSDVLTGSWRTVMRAVAAGELDLSALPPKEKAVIKRATSLNPKKRYANATEMARELARAATGQTNVAGYEEADSRPRGPGLPWLKIAASLLVVGGLAGGAYQYGPAAWEFINRDRGGSGTDTSAEFRTAQQLIRKAARDGGSDPALFDNVAALAKENNLELEKEDYDALATITNQSLNFWFRVLDQRDRDAIATQSLETIRKDRERIAAHLDEAQAAPVLNRMRLLMARQRLREQWPDPAERPSEAVNVLTGEEAALATGPLEAPGFVKNDAANLAVLRAIAAWPANADEVQFSEAAATYLQANAAEPSTPEKSRLDVLRKDLAPAARRQIAEQGIDSSIVDLKKDWETLGVDPLSLAMEVALEKDGDGDSEGARKLFDSLVSMMGSESDPNSAAHLSKVEWYQAIFNLSGGEAGQAMTALGERVGEVGDAERARLVEGLVSRFSRKLPDYDAEPTWATSELALVSQAVSLLDNVAVAQNGLDVTLQRQRLIAQRMLLQLLLPAEDGNDWSTWLADVQAVDAGLQQSEALGEALRGVELLEAVELCRAELNAMQPPDDGRSATSASVGEVSDRDLPGYPQYVGALTLSTRERWKDAAAMLTKLYATEGSDAATTAHIAGLDWPERRAKAADVLVAAAQSLRSAEDRDLSLPVYTPADAAAALAQLNLSKRLRGGPPAKHTMPILALATYYASPDSPPDSLLGWIEETLADDTDRAEPNVTALLLVSARLNAAAGKHEIAVARYAEALDRYHEWSKSATPNPARDAAVVQDVEPKALESADAIFEVVSGEESNAAREPLGRLYGGAARRLANQAKSTESNARREEIARYFERANGLAENVDTLRAEGVWLRHFITGRLDDDLKRLRVVAEKLPADDSQAQRLLAFVLHRGYMMQAEPVNRGSDLERAIALYDAAIEAEAAAGSVTPQLYLDRGDAYLKLAHVVHRYRAAFAATNATVFDYLKKSAAEAEKAVSAQATQAQRIEGLNLWGNASEDMSYYNVDPSPDGWKSHYLEAITHFESAYDEDQSAPIAAFNLARCRYRLAVAERRRDPANAGSSIENLNRSVNAAQLALTNWGDVENLRRAEAYYWLSKAQADLQKLDDADQSSKQAVDMALALDDPEWQHYQLEWARLAMRRWEQSRTEERKAEAKARATQLLELYDAQAAQPQAEVARRVDANVAAAAVGILIQGFEDTQAAIDSVKKQVDAGRFKGSDPEHKACRAEMYLALAKRIMLLRSGNTKQTFVTFAPQAAVFAKDVLNLTKDEPNKSTEQVNRAEAQWILGDLELFKLKPDTDADARKTILKAARTQFLAGVNEIPNEETMSYLALSERLDNVFSLAITTRQMAPPMSTPVEYKADVAVSLQYLKEIQPHLAALPGACFISNKTAALWLRDVEKVITAFELVK
jgi:serine/threonine protein kinase